MNGEDEERREPSEEEIVKAHFDREEEEKRWRKKFGIRTPSELKEEVERERRQPPGEDK